jgi:predicted TIM-barrel fold metal-dependent hydrolase
VKDTDRYILISADTHAGADLRAYRPYLESKYHADFDAWVAGMDEQAEMMREMMGPRSVGVDGDPIADGNRNYDSARRLREMESDGMVAEVIFPNTQPPFAPRAGILFAAPPVGDSPEHRWAGLRAHNRWLADFCAEAPGRRAGVAQIMLANVEGSVAEVEWAREHGLFGGVLLPGAPPGSGLEPIYAAQYEPIWAACEDFGMPLNHHAGGGVPDFGHHFPASMAMFMLEVTWWGHRALWHLMFSGVFDRHPTLQYTTTETGSAWIVDTLAELDSFFDRMKAGGQGSEAIFGAATVAGMSLRPSEYYQRQCHLGSSFLRPIECAMRHQIGVDQIMWGSDYPHIEGSYPFTRQHLRRTFAGVDPDEVQRMVGGNAAKLYGFDLDLLRPLAERFGPTVAEVAAPLPYSEVPEAAHKCPGLAPHTQVALT